MTLVATRPNNERRSSTANDGARPCAVPLYRRQPLSIRSIVPTDPVETVGTAVGGVLITYVSARGTARHRRRSHYSHSDNHRA